MSPAEIKSARNNHNFHSRRNSSSSSSENSVLRKLNLVKSKHLTDLYKKMYAEITNKAGRKLQKRLMSNSKSKSSYSESLRDRSADSSVGNEYTDSDNDA